MCFPLCWRWTSYGSNCLKIGSFKGYLDKKWLEEGAVEYLKKLPSNLNQPGILKIKDSRTTSLFKIVITEKPPEFVTQPDSLTEIREFTICVKRYNYQNFFYALKTLFRKSRGKKVWEKAQILLNLQVSIPYPLAYLERRNFGLLKESLFVTTWIDNAFSLEQFFENNFKEIFKGAHLKEKHHFINQVAHYLKNIHDLGIFHRDLKSKNILVKTQDKQYHFYLLDLDSLKIKRNLSYKNRLKDLARLNMSFLNTRILSKSNRLRFLINYLEGNPQANTLKKIYWRKIVKETENKLRKTKKNFI